MGIQDFIQQHLTPETITQISRQIGADSATTQKAVSAAVPMLIGGVAAHASTAEGAQALETRIAADQNPAPAASGGLGGMLEGAGGLGGVLGGLGGMMSAGGDTPVSWAVFSAAIIRRCRMGSPRRAASKKGRRESC